MPRVNFYCSGGRGGRVTGGSGGLGRSQFDYIHFPHLNAFICSHVIIFNSIQSLFLGGPKRTRIQAYPRR